MPNSPYYLDDADALVTAALCGDYNVIVQLINAGANVNVRNELGRAALMVAVDETYSGIVKLLLENGADPSIPDNDGDFPLDVARYSLLFRIHHDTEIVDLLIAHSGKASDGTSAKEKRDDLVYEAFGSVDAVRRLLSEIEKKKDS